MTDLLRRPQLTSLLAILVVTGAVSARQPVEFVPIGVRYQLDADPIRRRQDLEELRRLRFNVVGLSQDSASGETELGLIDRLLGGASDARVRLGGIATIAPDDSVSAASVRLAAWYAIGMGARGVVFGDWAALQRHTDALTAAVEFADHVGRNTALYAPLRPRIPKESAADVTVKGGDARISARFLESPDALVLIVANHHKTEPIDVTLAFSPEMPEAIWQNMLTGVAVNFVAGPDGPIYTRTFPPQDVLVLMIRKQLK